MRKAFMKTGAAVGRVMRGIGATARSNAEELAVGAGLALITVGFWPLIGVTALVIPGVVIVWLWLPSRLPLLIRPASPDARRKR
jgi:hypothetical protein